MGSFPVRLPFFCALVGGSLVSENLVHSRFSFGLFTAVSLVFAMLSEWRTFREISCHLVIMD